MLSTIVIYILFMVHTNLQDIVDLPIINLQDAGRPFKIKVSTIHMTIARALERFNECIRAEFLEWHIGLLKRRMEKMEIVKEAQHLKAAEARSTCKECEEYGHVQDQQGHRHYVRGYGENIEEFRWQGDEGRKLYM
jgi:ribosomal protein S9